MLPTAVFTSSEHCQPKPVLSRHHAPCRMCKRTGDPDEQTPLLHCVLENKIQNANPAYMRLQPTHTEGFYMPPGILVIIYQVLWSFADKHQVWDLGTSLWILIEINLMLHTTQTQWHIPYQGIWFVLFLCVLCLSFNVAASKVKDLITTDAMRPSRGSDIGAAENETHCCFSLS